MKVVAINGSARKDGNTAILINTVFDELKKEGIETELIQLAEHPLTGCRACYSCFKNLDGRCVVTNDILNDLLVKIGGADGLLLGSPTYFADVTSGMKAFIERCGFVSRANNYLFKRKVGASVVAVRRAGAIQAFNSMNLFLYYMQMVMPGSSYFGMALGRHPGDVLKDEEGLRTMRTLGENMAWLLKKCRS